jgi:putative PIN family toxin of toxin-antitoxin system
MKKGKRDKIVFDTNVLLVSISSFSKYHWIYELIIKGEVLTLVSNDILLEYEEIIGEKYNNKTAKNVIRALLELNTVHQISPYFNFELISNDLDDNKFVDCAIAGNAEFIVTNDKDFNVLKEVDFPKVSVLSINEFKKRMLNKGLIPQ